MPPRVVGHEDVRRRFERAIARGRLASTYLFVGPSGIGKRAFALELTAALLCPQGSQGQLAACGTCESCLLLAAGNHPDVHQVARPPGKSTLPIGLFIGDGDKRNQEGLCHEISLKPYLGSRRVAIIDDADDLNDASANCLLKTLEEPPPRSLLILIGVSASRQLPTIRSRCQVVRFSPLATEDLRRVLEERNLLEPGEDPQVLARAGEGSVEQAIGARDNAARQFLETLLARLSAPSFDPISLSDEISRFCASGGAEPSVKRDRLALVLSAAVEHYRGAMIDPASSVQAAEAAISALDLCLTAEAALNRNANQATLTQTWLVNLWRSRVSA